MSSSLHYACQRCGNCCRWPGDVRLTSADTSAIAEHLNLDEDTFIQQHTTLTHDRTALSLTQKPDGSCPFLESNSCSIQSVKPSQCRGFPNSWRFPGWRQLCAAVPTKKSP